jgi:hypothetical protein
VIFHASASTVLEAAMENTQAGRPAKTACSTLYDARTKALFCGPSSAVGATCLAAARHDMSSASTRRHTDFRTGERLGKDDHLVFWSKPARPTWMSAEQYAELPDELTLREVRIRVAEKGFRTR